MNKMIIVLLLMGSLQAEQTGSAAAASAKEAKSSDWENWVFAVTAIVTATLGIIATAVDDGQTAH